MSSSRNAGSQDWAFSNAADRASVTAFTDRDNSLGLGGAVVRQTSANTWLLHLDDAASYLYDDDDNDIVVGLRIETTDPPPAVPVGQAEALRMSDTSGVTSRPCGHFWKASLGDPHVAGAISPPFGHNDRAPSTKNV